MGESNVGLDQSAVEKQAVVRCEPYEEFTIKDLTKRLSASIWLWEILSLLLSVSCVAAILIILKYYNGRPLPDWGYGLTLNGVVSILAGMAKASMILPIAEAISQLKWYLYSKKERSVGDFQLLDTASRGPWGCLILMLRPRLWSIVSLGAALTVAAIALEPCLQLIPSFPSQVMVTGSASVPRSVYLSEWTAAPMEDPVPGQGVGASPPRGLKGAFYSGVFGSQNASASNVQPFCPTGNCTWPTYSSLAMCSECRNVTSYLKDQRNWWSLPTGVQLMDHPGPWAENYGGAFAALRTTVGHDMIGEQSIVFQNGTKQAIADASWIYAVPLENATISRPHASECLLHFCVKTYQAAVRNGLFEETVIRSWPKANYTVPDQPKVYIPQCALVGINCQPSPLFNANESYIHQNFTLSPPGEATSYNVSVYTMYLAKQWLSTIWTGTVSFDPNQITIVNTDPVYALYEGQRQSKYGTLFLPNQSKPFGPIDPIFDDVAHAMTAYIRNQGSPEIAARGEAMSSVTVMRARWWWALPPVALLLLAVMFLLSAIILSARRGIPMWKSSALATLLHSLDEGRVESIHAHGPSSLEAKAQHCNMKLGMRRGKWMLQDGKDP